MDSYVILKPVLENVNNNLRVAMTIRLMQVSKYWKQYLEPKWKVWIAYYLEKEKEQRWRLKYFYRCDLLRQVWHNEYIEKWVPIKFFKRKNLYVSHRILSRIIMGIKVNEPCEIILDSFYQKQLKMYIKDMIEYDPPYFHWLDGECYDTEKLEVGNYCRDTITHCIQRPVDRIITTKPIELWIKVVYCKITIDQILKKKRLNNELYNYSHSIVPGGLFVTS